MLANKVVLSAPKNVYLELISHFQIEASFYRCPHEWSTRVKEGLVHEQKIHGLTVCLLGWAECDPFDKFHTALRSYLDKHLLRNCGVAYATDMIVLGTDANVDVLRQMIHSDHGAYVAFYNAFETIDWHKKLTCVPCEEHGCIPTRSITDISRGFKVSSLQNGDGLLTWEPDPHKIEYLSYDMDIMNPPVWKSRASIFNETYTRMSNLSMAHCVFFYGVNKYNEPAIFYMGDGSLLPISDGRRSFKYKIGSIELQKHLYYYKPKL